MSGEKKRVITGRQNEQASPYVNKKKRKPKRQVESLRAKDSGIREIVGTVERRSLDQYGRTDIRTIKNISCNMGVIGGGHITIKRREMSCC